MAVGGSVRIPAILSKLKQDFEIPIAHSVNADEAAVFGTMPCGVLPNARMPHVAAVQGLCFMGRRKAASSESSRPCFSTVVHSQARWAVQLVAPQETVV